MNLDYAAKQRDGFLEIVPDAQTDSPGEIMSYVDEVLARCRELGVDRLLLDHRKLLFQMEHAGAYEVALQCTDRMTDDLHLRIAIVARPERMEFARIYETIGQFRNIRIKAFDDAALAASWLKSKQG